MSSIIFEFEDGLGTQRIMIEAIRYKLKDMVQRKFDLCYSYIIVKWRRNELKIVCNMLRFRQGFTCNKNIGEL